MALGDVSRTQSELRARLLSSHVASLLLPQRFFDLALRPVRSIWLELEHPADPSLLSAFASSSRSLKSITAGWFLGGIRETEEQTMHEYRGSSYAAGGDEGAITIPNVSHLSIFCWKLGCSLGGGEVEDPRQEESSKRGEEDLELICFVFVASRR